MIPVVFLMVVLASGCATSRGAPEGSAAAFDAVVAAASRRCGCRIGVAARHLESGRVYENRADQDFEAASVVKIGILTEAMARVRAGEVDLAERWNLTDAKKASGSGTLLILDPGLNPTWNDLLTLMIGPSDNTATNAWIERLGIERVNERMAALGLTHYRLLARLPALTRPAEAPSSPPAPSSPQAPSSPEVPSPWKGFRLGLLTPREAAEWMARVARGEILDRASSLRIFEYLDKDPTRLRIARRFPSEYLWAGKSGSMHGVRNDAGILRTRKGRFAIAILTDISESESTSSADHPSVLAIADVAHAIVGAWMKVLPDVTAKPE